MRLSFIFAGSLALVSLPAFAGSLNYPIVSKAKAERDLPCFMNTSAGISIDLSRFCTYSSPTGLTTASLSTGLTTTSPYNSSTPSFSSGGSTPSFSSGGNCQNPDDLDSRGHRCGGRASSARSGGKR